MKLKAVSLVIFSIVFIVACHKTQTSKEEERYRRQKFQTQLALLSSNYIVGDVNQARESLKATVRLFNNQNFLDETQLSDGLMVINSRLSVLESKAGNDALAEAYLLKTRYWYLLSLESSKSPAEAIKKVNSFDKEKCKEFVVEFEKEIRKKWAP